MQNYNSKVKNSFEFLLVILTFNFLLFTFSQTALAASSTDLRQSIQNKSQELQKINGQIQSVQKQLDAAKGEKTTLEKELQKLQYTANQLSLSIKSSEITIEKLKLELNSLQYDIDEVRNTIQIKKETIAKLIRELQEKTRESLLLLFLKNKSLAETLWENQSIKNINSGLSSEVSGLKTLGARLDGKFKETSEKKQGIELETANLKHRKFILDDTKQERQKLLAQTKNQEKVYQRQLSELEKKQAAISDEIDVIEDELRKSFDPSLLPIKRPGVLAWPIQNQRITQNFGEVSHLYRGKPHNGMDFGAIIGTEIFSADDGIVIMVGDNGRYQYGKYALIKHDNNLVTLYAHLSNNRVVQKGNAVKRGQLIGYSGNTGYSIGRGHLHFGLYWEPSVRLENFPNCNCGLVPIGITINPRDYL
ncbi:MAG: peptidoglycan DD-metalloendopeptidase family protein [Patescibacteria group bacterium]